MAKKEFEVTLYRYDISQGQGEMYGQMLGTEMEAIWHTAIVVYGYEYFFDGGCGIAQMRPKTTPFGLPLREESLGKTTVTEVEFEAWNNKMRESRFGGTSYELMTNNCNHYTNEASVFLTGKGVPDDVINMIPNMMDSPVGSLFTPFAEMAEQSGLLAMMGGMSNLLPKELPKRDPRARKSDKGPTSRRKLDDDEMRGTSHTKVEELDSDDDGSPSNVRSSGVAGDRIISPHTDTRDNNESEFEDVTPLTSSGAAPAPQASSKPAAAPPAPSGPEVLEKQLASTMDSAGGNVAALRTTATALRELLECMTKIMRTKEGIDRKLFTISGNAIPTLSAHHNSLPLLQAVGLVRSASGNVYQLRGASCTLTHGALEQMYNAIRDAIEDCDVQVAIAESSA